MADEPKDTTAPEEEAAAEEEKPYQIPTHMELGPWRIPLKCTVRVSAAIPILQLCADPQTQLLGFAAAIGYIGENHARPRWPLKARYRKMSGRWADYGAQVIDEFFEKGVSLAELNKAGIDAYLKLNAEAALWPSAAEVNEAQGN